MSTAENAKLQYEAGQNATAMSALTNSGDETTFTSGASLWSGKSGYAPVVRPNGLLTGGAVTVHADNDKVTVAALTCKPAGRRDLGRCWRQATITRPASDKARSVLSPSIRAALSQLSPGQMALGPRSAKRAQPLAVRR